MQTRSETRQHTQERARRTHLPTGPDEHVCSLFVYGGVVPYHTMLLLNTWTVRPKPEPRGYYVKPNTILVFIDHGNWD